MSSIISLTIELLPNLKRFLKPDGKVAIIEHKPKGGFSFVALFKHYTPAPVIMKAMEEAGYAQAQSFDLLPDQTFSPFVDEHVRT